VAVDLHRQVGGAGQTAAAFIHAGYNVLRVADAFAGVRAEAMSAAR